MTGVLIRKREIWRRKPLSCDDVGRDWSDVSTKAKDYKDYQELPETRRGKGGFSPRAFRGSTALPTP